MSWTLIEILEEPARTLDAWCVFEVPFDGPGQPWTRHFVGFRREGCTGQVSSPVEQLDPARRRGRTRSGRVYELAGGSGLNGDAFAAWGHWKASRHIRDERDITLAVEALLAPSVQAAHASANDSETVVSRVQQALRSLRYWDAASDLPLEGHRRHDLWSLALHEAAVGRLSERPELAVRALDVLSRWESRSDLHSQPLFREWRRIIVSGDWALAVERSDRGQQLRQASPLCFVLDPAERDAINRRFRSGRADE